MDSGIAVKQLGSRLILNACLLAYSGLVNAGVFFLTCLMLDDWGVTFIRELARALTSLNMSRSLFVPLIFGLLAFAIAYFCGRLSVTLFSKLAGRHQVRASYMLAIMGSLIWTAVFKSQLGSFSFAEPGSLVALCNPVCIAGIIHGVIIVTKAQKPAVEKIEAKQQQQQTVLEPAMV